MGEWNSGILGCMGNCGICIFSFLLPCYQVGKNAEALGDSCCLNACFMFIPVWNIIVRWRQRGAIRDRQGIDGGCLSDILYIMCCPVCSIAQEGQEAEVMTGGAMDMERA